MTASMPYDYKCPYTGFRKRCSKLRDECPKWVMLHGKNPNTGDPMPTFDCVDRWLPVLLIENAKETRAVTATLDEARKEAERRFLDAMDGQPEFIEHG
jgi:hypothetical protein